MSNGAILLGFLAILVAVIVHRTRRRMGLPVSMRISAITISVFVIVVLVMWVSSQHH